MDDRDAVAVVAAERLLDAAAEAAWEELVVDGLPPLLVRLEELRWSAERLKATHAAAGEPLPVVYRDALARLLAMLEQLRDLLAGVPDGA